MNCAKKCPVCDVDATVTSIGPSWRIDCESCGPYQIDWRAGALLEQSPCSSLELQERASRAELSYRIRRATSRDKELAVDLEMVTNLPSLPLPTPHEQLERLILWAGEDGVGSPGRYFESSDPKLRSIIGAIDESIVFWVADEGKNQGLLDSHSNLPTRFRLTMAGWGRYEKLKKGASDSKMAFMAMKFGQQPLTSVFEEYFQPAVARTGFHLETVIAKPKAGSIDDKIRVEIRNSKFIVVDLTHGNPGAYFEAGFAEGLGKSVIYTCEQKVFAQCGTHFDCNHHHTIMWNADDPAPAAEDLVNVIRNTLPGEAIMTDK